MQILNENDIFKASLLLQEGKLVCFPTETIYGLGADATNQEAVLEIFKAKGRPNFNPLIAHVSSIEMAEEIAEFTELAIKIAINFWPGPLTLILKKKECDICPAITAGLDTIAVRMPSNQMALDLICKVRKPIAAPSANKSGSPSPTEAKHVINTYKDSEIDAIIDGGRTKVGLESTILDLTTDTPTILRHGSITKEDIEAKFPIKIAESIKEDEKGKVKSPGQLLKHYAPNLNVRLNAVDVKEGEALITFGETDLEGEDTINLSPSGDLKEAGHNLFAALIELDDSIKFTNIAVTPIPNEGIGIAINDKLNRASSKK